MIKKTFSLCKVLTNIFALSFGVFLVGQNIAMKNSLAINGFLGVSTSKVVDENGKVVNVNYYSSDFKSIKEVKENSRKVTKQVTDEGLVLLKNDAHSLPLKDGARINAYSVSSASLVYAGTGSSGTSSTTQVNLKDALEKDGFLLNQELYSAYQFFLSKKSYGRGASNGIGATFSIHEAPWSALPEAKNSAADAGIFVLSRSGGEGADLDITSGNREDMTNGNYLLLSKEEKDVLSHMKQLKEEGKLKTIVLFINSANPPQMDFVDDYGIDSILYASTLGEVGAQSFADILHGDVNPSGRSVDTFYHEQSLNPVYANFGNYSYSGEAVSDKMMSNTYVVYQEGIYNGYYYAETRYEDKVLRREGTGEFDYSDLVEYPFGYGCSFSQFSYSDFRIDEKENSYHVSVKVKNVSGPKGKEAVELYLQKPYTEYDRENGIEKAAVQLVAFSKTKLLNPGEEQTMEFEVPKKDLASYDASSAMTYVLDEGDYYFTVGENSHSAINNILAEKGKTVSDGMDDSGDAELAGKIHIDDFDDVSYSVSATGKEIHNAFDNVDINRYENRGENHVTYLSRSNWEDTIRFGFDKDGKPLNNQVRLVGNSDMKSDADFYNYHGIDEDTRTDYPTYSSKETDYDLIELRADEDGNPIPYEDAKWDSLLDQLSLEEQVNLLSAGLRSTSALTSIGKPTTIDHNGATGPMMPYNASSGNRGLAVTTNDPDKTQTPITYPSNSLVAATYNTDLIEEYGRTWGEDCLWAGYSGLYGPACNIHRGSYGGRAFEYYSEDPLLSGKICAALIRGLSAKGVYAYLKHCLLNDQETNREGVNTWANEQTIREIYLKPFEIAIEEGHCPCVMTGFNRLGTIWTGAHGFLNTVLRGEFGMTGFAVSDFFHKEYMNLSAGIYNGNDLPDGQADALSLKEDADAYPGLAWAVRESTHRILYTVVHSNAMNGIAKGTHIVEVTPGWEILLNVLVISFGVLTALSIAGLCISYFVKPKAD